MAAASALSQLYVPVTASRASGTVIDDVMLMPGTSVYHCAKFAAVVMLGPRPFTTR